MLQVTDATDVLEPTTPADKCYATHVRARALPASRRGRLPLFPALRSWLMPLLRLHTHREQTYSRQMPQKPTMSIDLLARKYPDLYRRITSWSI